MDIQDHFLRLGVELDKRPVGLRVSSISGSVESSLVVGYDLLVKSVRSKGSDSMALLDLLLSEPNSLTLLDLLPTD